MVWSPRRRIGRTAPFGPGSVQRFVPEDGTSHYFTLREDPARWPALRTIAALDVVANNADRKSGHVLLAEDRLWAIDHGLCFHEDEKLRTVIWDFAGDDLTDEQVAALEHLVERGLPDDVAELLDTAEGRAVLDRADALARARTLPEPDAERDWPPYPWPLV